MNFNILRTTCVTTLAIISILSGCLIQNMSIAAISIQKYGSIDIEFQPIPDVIDAGKKIKFLVLIKTKNYPAFINSTELITPWGNINNSMNLLINANRTSISEMEFKIPANVSGGKYLFDILASTPVGDYTNQKEVTVKKIQSIPLSGDIPLSVLVIVFSGIITYSIVVFLLTRKFERSYMEVTIVSIGLGLFNWLILNQINIIGDWGIISDQPQSIAILMLFSIGIGLSIVVIVSRAIFPLHGYLKTKDIAKRRFLDLRTTGLTSSENIWLNSIRAQLNTVKQRLGRDYSLVLKINLKSDSKTKIEGILHHYEPRAPHDLFLSMSYTVTITDRDVLASTLVEKESPLFDELQNKAYRTKIVNYIITLRMKPNDQKNIKKFKKALLADSKNKLISEELKNILTEKLLDINAFVQVLNRIDFSRFAWYIVKRLKNSSSSNFNYTDIFISGDDISNVEIIKYQSAFVVSLKENGKTYFIPGIYEKGELHYVSKQIL